MQRFGKWLRSEDAFMLFCMTIGTMVCYLPIILHLLLCPGCPFCHPH